jgi:hypothetical protein
MTYDPNIPPPTTSPQLSPTSIRTNYAQFASVFSALVGGEYYNHMPLNNTNQGKHAAVLMEKQTVDPGVTQDLTVLYCKDTTTSIDTQPQIYAQIPKFLPTSLDTNNVPNDPMQLTYNYVNTAGPTQYQSFLPGGYVLYFGSVVGAGVTITLSPKPSKILMAQAIPQGTYNPAGQVNVPYDTGIVITQSDKLKVDSGSAPAGATFLWLAIAKA